MLARVHRIGALTVVADKGYASRDFQAQAADMDVLIVRPRRKHEPGKGPHLAPIRQCVESIFQTMKHMRGLEHHGARELHTLRARLAAKFLALSAAIALNHRLGRHRATVDRRVRDRTVRSHLLCRRAVCPAAGSAMPGATSTRRVRP